MVSKNDVGATGPIYRFPIEEGKVREFAGAIGWALNDDSKPEIPPTFLGIAGRLWGYTFDDPKDTALAAVDIDRSLLLHAEEEYEFPGDVPRVGDTLFVRTYIKDVFEREGKRGGKMTFVVAETEFKNDADVIVAFSRQTVVKTESAAA